jgi:ABC-2 type transport system permease protein
MNAQAHDSVRSEPQSDSSEITVWTLNTQVILALWQRDMMRLMRERTRWLGVILQPLLFWAVLGLGMGDVFAVKNAQGLDYLEFFFPGTLVMIVLFTTVFATMAVIEDRQQGFLQQVLVGPGSRAAMVAGKTLGVTTIAMIQALLCLLVAPLAGFDLLAFAWPSVILSLMLTSVGLTGLSFAMAWVLGSTHAYHSMMAVLLLPLWMISGAMFPPPGGGMDVVMALNPMTYMVDTLRHGLYGGVAPVSLTGPTLSLTIQASFAVLAFCLAVATSRNVRHLDS